MAIKEKFRQERLTWIDVTEPSAAEMEQLGREYHLNQYTLRDCLQPEHLPKYEYDEESKTHFLILRFYAQVMGKNAASIQELTNKIAIFYTDSLVITIHLSATPFLDVIARKADGYCTSTTDLLARIVWQGLETFDDPAARLSEQVDFYENQVLLHKTSNDVTEALYYIKRQASLSHKVLMLMTEPINHIHVREGDGALIQDVRDQHLKMQTLYMQVTDDVNNLLNLTTSFAAQRTNDVMRILTLFSVFFMPLTFVVGIYGMNFEFMPELRQRWGYPAVLVVMLAITAVIYTWFKRKNWL